MSTQPPQLPPNLPPGGRNVSPPVAAQSDSADSTYNLMADKIGGVPNIRKKDNLYQALAVLICSGLGALAGWLIRPNPTEFSPATGVLLGLAGGMIVGVIASGVVLMVIGWFRKS